MKYAMKQHLNLSDFFHAFNSDNLQYYDSIKFYLSKTLKVKGDILEFGIGRGRSLIAICHLINDFKIKKKFIAFDSFKGFDYISLKDKSYRNPKKREWSASPKKEFSLTKKNIKKIISNHIFQKNFKDVRLVKGFVEETLEKEIKKIKLISFIDLDLDLYSGHKTVLENCFDKLSKNGLIYFDDVILGERNPPFPGPLIAVNEFFKNKKVKKYIYPLRKNLIIKKI